MAHLGYAEATRTPPHDAHVVGPGLYVHAATATWAAGPANRRQRSRVGPPVVVASSVLVISQQRVAPRSSCGLRRDRAFFFF